MPSSARRIMFPISGTFRRIRTRVPRADEGIGPYIGYVIGPVKFQFICFTVKPTYIKIGVPWHAGFLKRGCLYLPGRIRVQVFDIVQVIGKGGGDFGIESAQAAGGAGHGSGSSFGIGAWQEGHELVGADLGKGISGP